MSKVSTTSSRLPSKLLPYITIGHNTRQAFVDRIDEFFDDFDSHLYIRGQAGIGKTYTVTTKAAEKGIDLCLFSGNVTLFSFAKQLAVSCYIAGWPGVDDDPKVWAEQNPDTKVVVYIDDCTTLYEANMLSMLKIALEDRSSDKFSYGSSLGAQVKQANPLEQEAIAHFIKNNKAGFEIPFHNRVKFIFTMNRELSNLLHVTKARNTNKSFKAVGDYEDRYAIFSRVDYEDLYLEKNEYWGWIADLLLNENILEGATVEQCEEILYFCYQNWEKLTDMSVRSVHNKLWRPMKKHLKNPNNPRYNYLNKWDDLVSK